MKKLFPLTLLEKIMLLLLMTLICLLMFFSYAEQSKHAQFINSLKHCSNEKTRH